MIKLFSFFVMILVSNCVIAQDQNGSSDSSSRNGKVYYMRLTGFQGSAGAFTVFIDDTIVCRLNNKRYSIHEVTPGTHRFSVQFAGKKSKEKAERVEINVEAGKEYYIQLIFQPGLLINNLFCQEVTANSAKTILPRLKVDMKCE